MLAAVEEAVAAANQQLARVQQVKRWRLLPVEWTAESEELTPTLKLKRRVVHAKYADDIDIAVRRIRSAAEASGCLVAPPVFKTGERRAASLAGSIPVRLRHSRPSAMTYRRYERGQARRC